MIGAGKRNRLVHVEQQQETRSSSGAVTVAWVPVLDIWCAIRAVRGDSRLLSLAPTEEVDHVLEGALPQSVRITGKMRARTGSDTFDIRAVFEDPHRRSVEMMATLIREA